ncbi:hypothetical protein CJF32_00002448 [Rutstroemia sp. NJR-2017a WRK4]|nr:hypothetical protein CJF32_00002111 [Rutstroemia sp. NJR-2017a WRK4]PQE14929.1 hypothetical protein CJF32_00002448 [Rutstroemia sp. NJR-2017a WRK4]
MSADQQEQTPTAEDVQEDTNMDSNMDMPESPPDMTFTNNGFSETPATTPSKTNDPSKINHGAPGSSWNTKKFREEYDRAYESLIDKNWDGAKRYGDPLIKD